MKAIITITATVEYEMNPDHYPDGLSPEEMLALDVDSALSTILAAYRKTTHDNIFKDSAFLYYLRMSKCKDPFILLDGAEMKVTGKLVA
jgi:hypothetical protein